MEPSLAESIYIRFSIKFLHFVPFRQQIWPPRAILVSDWLMLKNSSPLKLLGKMEPNLAGSIYARSSIKLLHLIPFGQQTWPPRLILFFWLANVNKIFSSETAWPNGAKPGRKRLCKVQTWHRWSLGVSLSKLCPIAPPSIQDGCCFLR